MFCMFCSFCVFAFLSNSWRRRVFYFCTFCAFYILAFFASICIFCVFLIFVLLLFYSILLFCTARDFFVLLYKSTKVDFFLIFIILHFLNFVYFLYFLYFCTLSFGWTVHMNFHAKSGVWIVDNSLRVQVQYALVVLPPINRKEIYPQNQTPLKILPPIITQKENFQNLQVTILHEKEDALLDPRTKEKEPLKSRVNPNVNENRKKFPINWLHSEWPRAWCRFGQRNNIPKNNKSQQCRLWRLWWRIIW